MQVSPTWSILEAASGETALQQVEKAAQEGRSSDLIFMDHYMSSTEKQLLGT